MKKFDKLVESVLTEYDTHPRTYLDIKGQSNIPEKELYKLGSEYKRLASSPRKVQKESAGRMKEIRLKITPYLDDEDDFEAFWKACD